MALANKQLLYDHLTVSDENGTIHMNDDRMIVISSSAFGTLRKDLIENLGTDRMKGFLIRYGWDLGVKDAKKVIEMNLPTVEDIVTMGTILHMIKGHTGVQTDLLNIEFYQDGKVKSIHMEGAWVSSYEAHEHVCGFGHTESPVCHTLIGYASGYLSTVCNQRVIVKELTCAGMGHTECRYLAKSLELWDGEVNDILRYYEDTPIVIELEMTYEKLLEERNTLSRISSIHKKLTEEILNGNDLQSIADVVYDTTGISLIIEDVNFRSYAYSGLSPECFQEVNDDFQDYIQRFKKPVHEPERMENESFLLTSKINAKCHFRLITPIFIRKKISGYCSFVYQHVDDYPQIDIITLEQIASVCSLYLLNEKTSLEATERMKGHFLEQILQEQFTSKKDILKRGSYLHFNLDQPFYIVALKYQNLQGNLANEMLFYEELMETTLQYFKDKKKHVLICHRGNNVVLYVQTESRENANISSLCIGFIECLSQMFHKYTFQIGVSSRGEEIDRASDYYDEAIIALRMSTPTAKKMVLFDSLGVVGLLINNKNESAIKNFAQQQLGPLYDADCHKNTEFIKTLYVFLANGGNLEQTANDLTLSLSGLRYRIQKMETLLGQDLRNPTVNYQLFLMLQALLVIGEIEM